LKSKEEGAEAIIRDGIDGKLYIVEIRPLHETEVKEMVVQGVKNIMNKIEEQKLDQKFKKIIKRF